MPRKATSSPHVGSRFTLPLYRVLLRAFPSDFRSAYGTDLVDAFKDGWRAKGELGDLERMRFVFESMSDVVRQGLGERWARLRGTSGPVPPKRPGSGVRHGSWGTRFELAWNELRLAARALARRPAYAWAVVAILGLSLTGATTLWGTVYHVSVAPLGFEDEDRLARIWFRTRRASTDEDFGLSDGLIRTLRERSRSFNGIGYVFIVGATQVLHAQDRPPERVSRLRVSENFFDILGVEAALGRTFGPGDEDLDVVLLSHGAWERRYGADPDVLGRTLRLGDDTHTIVGVLPERFRWLDAADEPVEIWATVALVPERFDPFYFFSVARLRADVTHAQAQAEVSAIFESIHDEAFPLSTRRPERLASVRPLKEDFLGSTEARIDVLVGALVLVGLLGTGTVAMLLLIRTVGRARESAVRVALGGGARQVAGPILAELVLLLLASGVIALVSSWLALDAIRAYGEAGLVRGDAIALSPPVLAGGLTVALLVALAALGVTALGLRRQGGRAVLQAMADSVSGGRLPRTLRAPLIVTQVAVSVILVVGAGLLGRSFIHLSAADPGFEPSGVLTGDVLLPTEPFWDPVPEARDNLLRIRREMIEFHRSLRERLAADPSVIDVTLAKHAPLSGRYGGFTPFRPEWFDGPEGEMPGGRRWVASNEIAPDFLPFLDVELLEGRWLTPEDDENAPPVALISEDLAGSMWPDGDALGSRYEGSRIRLDAEGRTEYVDTWITVVGVVAGLRELSLRDRDETVYRTLAQTYPPGGLVHSAARGARLRMFVRHRGDPAPAAAHMRAVVGEILPGVPVDDLRGLDDMVGHQLREPRFYLVVFGAFGLLALALALGGIAAVIGYGVSRRTREIGLRMALGAWSSNVFRLIATETLVLSGIGVALGVVIAYSIGRFLESMVYGVQPQDPLTLVAGAALFMLMALLAALLPTRRALEVDPARSLRHE